MVLKAIKKSKMRDPKQVENLFAERAVLADIRHPFICKMTGSFQTHKKIIFVMDFLNGGDLFSLL